jgi:acetoin:2,6-dichlorophenolindophenol oxidoreductase subunit alpha
VRKLYEKLRLLETMLLIRGFEERAKGLHRQGLLVGALHLYIGQEAVATGVCAALEPGDYVVSTHRGHGHALAKGCEAKRVMAELLGKEAGYSRGRGGSMHIFAPEIGYMGGNGIVGGGIPMAGGIAYSSAYKNDGKVTISFLGDGASNQGTFHETINMAALWCLPIVFVCENNHWAATTPACDVMPVPDVSARAAGYGIPGVTVDGNDVEAVKAAADEAVKRARSGNGPTLLECKTLRHEGHCMVVQDCRLRTPEEERYWRERDPIISFEKKLSDAGATEKALKEVHEKVSALLAEAEESAKISPLPDVAAFRAENHLGGL